MAELKISQKDSIYPDDYSVAHEKFLAMEMDANRLIKFESRERRTTLDVDMLRLISRGKYRTTWNKVELLKGPFELVILADYFERERPATVIELGSYAGGSALWFADTMKAFGIKAHVYSVDYNGKLLHENAKKREDITFILGDLTCDMEKMFPAKMLRECPHPWFVTEDAHVRLEKTLGYLERFMEPGDYMVVEDTNPNMSALTGQGLYTEGYDASGWNKHDELSEFLKARPGKFLVDSYYTDFFGYNATHNVNSFLKRV